MSSEFDAVNYKLKSQTVISDWLLQEDGLRALAKRSGYTLENATVNVDVPRRPGFLDEETLLLQNLVSTDGREHSLGSAMGISYSNSGRAIPVRGPLTALSRTEMPVLFGSLGLSPRSNMTAT